MVKPKSYPQNWLSLFVQYVHQSSISRKVSLLAVFSLVALISGAQRPCDQIELNQVGYYPNSSKLAFVTCSIKLPVFYIVSADGADTVYQGSLGEKRRSEYSSVITRVADFSSFTAAGKYIVRIDNRQSFPFEIGNDVYTGLGKAVLKSFYYQRSSIPLEEKYAGKWNREAEHFGDAVVIAPSSFSDNRGTVISSPGGWYDEGDFNKYIVSSGLTMSTLLSAYEDFSRYFDTLTTNIPESGNKIPDVLNEVLYNLRWMFTMQDPFDGGVYHKCVNAKFEDITAQGVAKYSEKVEKTTAATLDFAAVMAQAGRIFKAMEAQLPGLSDSCLRASATAWFWALKNPDVEFGKAVTAKDFRPASVVQSSAGDLSDEWMWAATEMFVTSHNKMYFDVIEQNVEDSVSLPSVNNVGMLAYYTMLRYESGVPGYAADIVKKMKTRLFRMADDYLGNIRLTAFSTVMGQSRGDFTVGSNAVAANQGILLINAYLVSGNEKYVAASMSNLDYLLGRNATGYCFVTGSFGTKSPVHPCYHLSSGGGEPIPGLLVAGPYATRDRSFLSSQDAEASYQDSGSDIKTNQVSIDWNSAMVYLVNAIEAMQYELGFSPRTPSTIAVNR